jgi:hypothetical protein
VSVVRDSQGNFIERRRYNKRRALRRRVPATDPSSGALAHHPAPRAHATVGARPSSMLRVLIENKETP